MTLNFQAFSRRCASTFVLAMLALSAPIASIAQTSRKPLPSAKLALPLQAEDLNVLPSSQPLRLSVTVHVSDDRTAALNQFLSDVTTPGNPNYHHWLTPAEFASRFGATDNEATAASTWIESQGLHVESSNAARTVLTVSGTTASAQATFGTEIHQFQSAGVLHFANIATPSISADAASLISGVSGLNDFVVADASTLETASAAIDANLSSVLALHSLPAGSTEWQALIAQANAQGITVLADDSATYAGAMVIAPQALTSALTPAEMRPMWQVAPGLPADNLRAVPDFVYGGDFTATVNKLVEMSGGRLGNINERLYQIAAIPGVFTEPEGVDAGTWLALSGLGIANPDEIVKHFAVGTTTTTTSITAVNFSPTHGSNLVLKVTVASTIGGAIPTGTVTISSAPSVTIPALALDGTGTATYTTNQLAGGPYTFNATYNGDGTYATSTTTSPAGVNIQAEVASVSAIINGNPVYGSNVPIVVTVAGTSGIGNPAGTVTAADTATGSTAYNATLVPSVGGASTATISFPVAKQTTYAVQVVCTSTDSSFTCTSDRPTLTITPGATKTASTTTLTSSPNPPVTGAVTTFTATVASGVGSVTTVPTGTVIFQDNGIAIGSATLAAGKATFAPTLADGSVHVITATYGGDTVYTGSSSSSLSTPAGNTVSSISLASDPTPPVAGKSATFTATVTAAPAAAVSNRVAPRATAAPTGMITFLDNGTPLSSSALDTAGKATLTTILPAGTAHSVSANYSGSGTFAASTSPAIAVSPNVVGTAASTTSLLASAATITGGSNVTFTSVVKAVGAATSSPTGTVTLTDNKDGVIGSGTIGADGTLNVSLTTLSAGTHSVIAAYSGDTNFAVSVSPAVTVTVTPAVGTLTASVSPRTVAYGYTATVTASVSLPSGSATGTVQATLDGQIYTGTLAGGTVNIPVNAPKPGTYPIVVSCPTTNVFTCSNTVTLSLTVTKGATVTTLVSDVSTVKAGGTVTVTATIANQGTGTGTYVFTGTVNFLDGNRMVGTGTVSGNKATATVTITNAGNHSLVAVYSGDSNWFGNTSTPLGITATQLASLLTVSSNAATALNTANVTFTATATSAEATTLAPPTGTVTFYDTYNTTVINLGSAGLIANGPSQSIAVISTTGLQPGTHHIYAVYAGDQNYKTVTSNTLLMTINDFVANFSPSTLAVRQGSSAKVTVTLNSLNGFSGALTLGCTPPPDSLMTCSFSPSTLGSSGSSVLTVTTTANTASMSDYSIPWRIPAGGTVVASLLWFLVPKRRRTIGLLLFVVVGAISLSVSGCGSGVQGPVSGGTSNNGTPLGTLTMTVTVSGTDGITQQRRNYAFPVTVQ